MPGSFPLDDLLVTKLDVPLVGARIIPRRRLTEVLKAGMERRLTLLTAPAGYGKTTLLVEWLSGVMLPDWRTIWLTIDSFDNDPIRLWSYIATAVKKVYPRLRFDPQQTFREQVGKSLIESLTPLFNAITQAPYQLVLVLDDYQWITNERVHEQIRYLLDHQPKNLHLLISSRVTPPFPLSRLRAQGQMVELTAKDLSFTLPEAKKFFSSAMKMEIDPDQASSLLVATEGWIAGLQLVTLSLQGQPDRKAFIASLPEENYQIFEYLTEEVLDRQAPELRDFLLKTSLLSELSAPLCDAMLERKDSREMLNRIQQANLFIVALDERRYWYSYHRLFADTLQKYLRATNAEIIPELHRRACAWLQANGYPDKAVSHALACGDVEQAARIIDACAFQAVITFDLVQLAQWLGRFSDELISERPQLAVYSALANYLLERFDKVEPRLQALEQILGRLQEKGFEIQDEGLIRWEIDALRACLAYWQANSAESLASGVTNFIALRQSAPPSDRYFCGLMLHGLAEVYAVRGDLEAAIDAYSRGCQYAIDYGLLREYCYSQSEMTYVRKLQGDLRAAERDYQAMIEYALRIGLSEDVVAFAKAGLAEIALERNQMDQADALVGWVIENYDRIEASPRNWIRQEWLFVRLARYYLAREDIATARVFFEKAINGVRANRQVVHYLSTQLIDLQVKLWLATGELGSKELAIEAQMALVDPTWKSNRAKKTALARYHLAQGDAEQALSGLSALLPELEAYHMQERLMEALVIQALARQALGDAAQALASLHQALELAAPQGYHSVFTDEGEAMKALLEAYLCQPQAPEGPAAALARSLIADLEQKTLPESKMPHPASPDAEAHAATELIQPMPEPFSHRELEILKLIAAGKATKEIAAALMISVNTAKVHIKSIYRKTGTHTRTALLARAGELGLLK